MILLEYPYQIAEPKRFLDNRLNPYEIKQP